MPISWRPPKGMIFRAGFLDLELPLERRLLELFGRTPFIFFVFGLGSRLFFLVLGSWFFAAFIRRFRLIFRGRFFFDCFFRRFRFVRSFRASVIPAGTGRTGLFCTSGGSRSGREGCVDDFCLVVLVVIGHITTFLFQNCKTEEGNKQKNPLTAILWQDIQTQRKIAAHRLSFRPHSNPFCYVIFEGRRRAVETILKTRPYPNPVCCQRLSSSLINLIPIKIRTNSPLYCTVFLAFCQDALAYLSSACL